MLYRFIPNDDLSAIARATRRVSTDSALYETMRQSIQKSLSEHITPLTDEDASVRRAAFDDMLRSRLSLDADRMTAVSCALTTIKALTEHKRIPDAVPDSDLVTRENYNQKVDELLNYLTAYRPAQRDIDQLARGLGAHGPVQETLDFFDKRAHRLTLQAAGLYLAAQEGKLHSLDQNLTAEQAVNFALAHDAVERLQRAVQAGETGEIVGRLLCGALLACAFVGGVIALVMGITSLISISVQLAIGAWIALYAGAVLALLFVPDLLENCELALETLFDVAGEWGATLAIKASVKHTDTISVVDAADEEQIVAPDEELPVQA